jgi:hypothetical protein
MILHNDIPMNLINNHEQPIALSQGISSVSTLLPAPYRYRSMFSSLQAL